mgnify:CR=1 FL=1
MEVRSAEVEASSDWSSWSRRCSCVAAKEGTLTGAMVVMGVGGVVGGVVWLVLVPLKSDSVS